MMTHGWLGYVNHAATGASRTELQASLLGGRSMIDTTAWQQMQRSWARSSATHLRKVPQEAAAGNEVSTKFATSKANGMKRC